MAVVKPPTISRDAVVAIHDGVTIRHTICKECFDANAYRYSPEDWSTLTDDGPAPAASP